MPKDPVETPARTSLTELKKLLTELKKWRARVKQPSDFTLSSPKDHCHTEPELFNPWIDVYGRRLGRIDFDCAFQSTAFDVGLGSGHNPLNADGGSDRPSHAGGLNPVHQKDKSLCQDLTVKNDDGQKIGVSIGLLPGEREIKRRRPTSTTWWIFKDGYLSDFIFRKYPPSDEENRAPAARAAFVLLEYYLKNREDQDIAAFEGSSFNSAEEVKNLRQYLIREAPKFGFKELPPSEFRMLPGSNCGSCYGCRKNGGRCVFIDPIDENGRPIPVCET